MSSWTGATALACIAALAVVVTACGDGGTAATTLDDAGPAAARVADGSADARGPCRGPVYRDADGDGWGDPDQILACGDGGTLPAGYTTRASDCDDTDPSTQDVVYGDADGDMQGDPEAVECVARAAALPPGLVRDGRDCDDTDPSRRAYGFERWGDGVDQDCDGEDGVGAPECTCTFDLAAPAPTLDSVCPGRDDFFGLDAPVRPDEVAAALRVPDTVVANAACTDGADLVITHVLRCANCSLEVLHVVVANRGVLAAEDARLIVTPLSRDGAATAFGLGSLAPRQHSGLVTLPRNLEGPIELTASTASPSCQDAGPTVVDIARYECGLFL